MLWHKTIGAGGTGGGGEYSTQTGTIVRGSSVSTLYPSYPTDIQAGDLLIIDGLLAGNETASTPNGWNGTYNGAYRPLFFRTATGSESGFVTVSWGGFRDRVSAVIWMVGIRFSTGTSPYIIGESQGNGSNLTLTPPSTLNNGLDYNLLGVARVSREDSPTVSPTPTSTLFSLRDSQSGYVWQWDDNTSNISVSTGGTNFNWRYVTINVE